MQPTLRQRIFWQASVRQTVNEWCVERERRQRLITIDGVCCPVLRETPSLLEQQKMQDLTS
jgi:hypothetical protein